MQIFAETHLLVRLAGCVAYCTLISFYVQRVVCKYGVGWGRFLTSLPPVLLNFVVPFVFSLEQPESILRLSAYFLITWLSNFKILAFCLNRGLLTPEYLGKRKQWTFWQYTVLLSLPMLPEKDLEGSNCDHNLVELWKLRRRIVQFTGKLGLMFLGAYILGRMNPPILIKEYLYALSFYTFLGVWMDSTSILCSTVLDVRVVDNFQEPYLCTSLADFWSKWNRVTAVLLKALSFDIICEGCWVKKQQTPKRVPIPRFATAVLVVFALSGVMHELLFWYSNGWAAGGWFLYFSWFGPANIIEKLGQEFFKHFFGITRFPYILGIVYVFLSMSVPGIFLFSPQTEKAGSMTLANKLIEVVFNSPAN